ncbi:MAG: pyridoxal phosphate-dependent aminotransferase [Dehalococcoidia bacterium]|nr:MAG: pyridoxal phosphate-dependent aminotransferase [Dehalococcoidia bacterium]
MDITSRVDRLPSEPAIRTFLKARGLEASGREIVHLEIGEPDFATPEHIRVAAKKALDAGQTHYCDSQGVLELRQAIADKVSAMRNVAVDPADVVVTPGLRPILFYGALMALDKGDEGIYFDPAFAAFPSVIEFAGAKPVAVPLRRDDGFRLDVKALEAAITPRTRLITLNSPHNPTGAVLSTSDFEAIADLAVAHDLTVLSDETYEEIYYDERPRSVIEFPRLRERSIVMSGFSKTYCMTGWRLGYAILPPRMADAFTRLAANSVTCSTTFVQYAAVEALQGPQDCVVSMVEEFRRRRDVLVEGLNRIPGITCHSPCGAFYAFADVRGVGLPDTELANMLLEKGGVATLAGSTFGEQGVGYLRLSYTTSMENILKALERIERVVSSLPVSRAA